MFFWLRKSSNGVTMLTWLRPDPVYVKRHVRNKDNLLAHDAELIEANPHYAHVRFNNCCRKTIVSLRDLAPHPQQVNCDRSDPTAMSTESTETRDCARSDFLPSTSQEPSPSQATNTSPDETHSSQHCFMILRQRVICYGLQQRVL